ncbi:hypothetical protein JW868_01240 [Candidatus Woesearchaeota archaeon]|nr:hypothetical protein [Candidatus Woesearchaeota archaeon]
MDWIFLILAATAGVVFTGGDIFLKYWATKASPYFLVFAFLLYIIAGTLTAFSMKRKEIAVAIAVLICVNLIAVAVLGFTLFKETLNLKAILGISLALVAVIILSI